MTSSQKPFSVNRCIFTWRTITLNFIRSDLKRWSLRLFLKSAPNNQNNKKKNKINSEKIYNVNFSPQLKYDCYLGVVKSMSVMLMRSPRCSSMRHGQVREP